MSKDYCPTKFDVIEIKRDAMNTDNILIKVSFPDVLHLRERSISKLLSLQHNPLFSILLYTITCIIVYITPWMAEESADISERIVMSLMVAAVFCMSIFLGMEIASDCITINYKEAPDYLNKYSALVVNFLCTTHRGTVEKIEVVDCDIPGATVDVEDKHASYICSFAAASKGSRSNAEKHMLPKVFHGKTDKVKLYKKHLEDIQKFVSDSLILVDLTDEGKEVYLRYQEILMDLEAEKDLLLSASKFDDPGVKETFRELNTLIVETKNKIDEIEESSSENAERLRVSSAVRNARKAKDRLEGRLRETDSLYQVTEEGLQNKYK